jgi:hypothetical protein
MTKNKSDILNEKEGESVSFPLEMDFKPEIKAKQPEIKKTEYVIENVTPTKVIAVDKHGNGVDFPREDFIDPKVGDKFQA